MHSAFFLIQAQDSTLEGTPGNLVPLYRYWNPERHNHFYTIDPRFHVGTNVPGEVRRNGYQCGGIECFIYRNNPNPLDMQVRPLNCYFCRDFQDYYYTANDDNTTIRMYGMNYDQEYTVGFCPAKNNVDGYTVVTLHEYWNPNTRDHFYTINQGDLGQRQERPGYIYQRRVCNVLVST